MQMVTELDEVVGLGSVGASGVCVVSAESRIPAAPPEPSSFVCAGVTSLGRPDDLPLEDEFPLSAGGSAPASDG